MSANFEARFERKMEFILDTLASVSAKNDETATLVKKLAERQDKTDRQLKGLQTLVKIGMKMIVRNDAKINALTKRTDEKFAAMSEKFDRWLDSGSGSNGHKNGGGKKRG